MITEVTMYRVVCDGPDCTASAQDYGDFYAWLDDDAAEQEARDGDWLVTEDGKHLCPKHQPDDDVALLENGRHNVSR